MQVKINSSGGFELLDTDTNETFEFAGNLLKLQEAINNYLTQEEQLREGLAFGKLYVKTVKAG